MRPRLRKPALWGGGGAGGVLRVNGEIPRPGRDWGGKNIHAWRTQEQRNEETENHLGRNEGGKM